MINANDMLGVNFRKRHMDPELARGYAMTDFRKNALTLNCLFASAVPFMDLSHTSFCSPSFLRLQRNTSIAIRMPYSRYNFLWLESPPNMNPQAHARNFMKTAVKRADFR